TAFVLLMSNTLVSSLRHAIPKQVRIASYIAIIATFVTAVDYIVQAISLELHKSLGAYVSLIVVNCVILGRAEAFASKNNLKRSVYDALGMGLGFTLALLCLGVIRELLGSGTFFNLSIMPGNFEHWVIMLLPGGAFFVLALWMLLINRLKQTHHKSKGSTHE
ncbi:MAG: Rnf-Nqr domain containing protein, partial [Gammaproteobacteria bacterium]